MKKEGKMIIMVNEDSIEIDEAMWDLFEKTCRKEGSDPSRVLEEFMLEELSKRDLSEGFKKLVRTIKNLFSEYDYLLQTYLIM